jgi:hypothetical protein
MMLALVGAGLCWAGCGASASSPARKVPGVSTQRVFVAQLHAVAGTLAANQQAWEACRRLGADPARLTACQVRAYAPSASAMRARGVRIAQLGAMVPHTHCASEARAAVTGMPAAVRQWASGRIDEPHGAITPEGQVLTDVYNVCTAPPVWKLGRFPGALDGP